MWFVWKHTQPEFEHPVLNIHSKYLCSHCTVKASSYSTIWESHLEKSSLLTYVPLVERLANKLSTVNYALIQVPMWCVPAWIHLHMSRHMYAYEHKSISFLFTSFSYWYEKCSNCHVSSQAASPIFCGRPGYTCFFPVKRLSPWYPLPKLPLTDFRTNPALLVRVRVLNKPS